jgi:ribonucleoside-diphosphate reductase alpha chain
MEGGPYFTKIRKRDGSIVEFHRENIAKVIWRAAQSVGGKDKQRADELSHKVVEFLKSTHKKNYLLSVEEIQDAVERILIEEGHAATAKHYILYRHEKARIREEKADLIGGHGGKTLSLNALKLLKERYLLRDNHGDITETPEELFKRVAHNIAKAELQYKKKDVKETAEEFYQMLLNLDFLPNTPCLMNAGTPLQQLCACFVLPVKDSIDDIYRTLRHTMLVHKTGGGTGFNFSLVRPRLSVIKSSKGGASGPVSFMRVYNAATEVIKQGGKKRGANMGVLAVNHPDILEFIHCKDRDGEMKNFNVSVLLTDDFMNKVVKNKDYSLIDPTTGEKVVEKNARYVFDSLVASAWQHGDPGVLFVDRINKDNPTPEEGALVSTSSCAEQPLLDHEACFLGSINLGNFVADQKVEWIRLRHTIGLAVRFLDNMIDMNKFLLPQIKEIVLNNRKIGLGIMGFADMLVKLRIPYDSNDGLGMADKVMGFIRKEADLISQQLAMERGPFLSWERSIYQRGKKFRNATRLSIAPTGSISMIADASAGVEPLFALSYMKKVMGGKEFYYVDKNFKEALDEKGLKTDEIVEHVLNQASIQHVEQIPKSLRRVFVVAHDISPEWHVKMQAEFQQHVDNAISKTVNFPNSATIKDVEKLYLQAWRLGCKGITLYRDGSKGEQVIHLN